MADECDIANDRADSEREYLLGEIRRKIVAEPAYFTNCQWCGDPTEGGAKFCGTDCRDDASRSESAAIRAGAI